MTFLKVNAVQQTDRTFMLQTHEGLHNGDSPLINTGVGMVSQLPIYYMHLVCSGLAKRILLMRIKVPLNIRIGPRAVEEISTALQSLKAFLVNLLGNIGLWWKLIDGKRRNLGNSFYT